MNRPEEKALIIGCGIAGPVVALFLQRAGIEAEIYEARAASTDYGGNFLNMACNGLGGLKPLGLDGLVSQQGSPIPRMVMWSGKGKRLGEVSNGTRADVGNPSINILRSRLHQVLREEAENRQIPIAYGKKLVDLENGTQGVVATFVDGTTAEGTFLIGCDGVHSRTRRLINPDASPPHYTDLIGTGGFAAHSRFAPTPDTMHFVFGKRAFFGYHVSASQDLYWFANILQREPPSRGDLDLIASEEWQQRMLDLFHEDIPLICEMIRAIESTIIGYPFYDIPTQPVWHKGRTVLVGDAIHAVSPSAGQGASLAVEDAAALAKCLRDIPDHTLAFTTYERLRRARVERLVQHGRNAGQGKIVTNPIGMWLRDLSMPLIFKLLANSANSAAGRWIYSYQINWDEKVS
jgi:2-polyprenyl-6-methoxyphenol hydroxylase-like FAD-dependent oxidoreductase